MVYFFVDAFPIFSEIESAKVGALGVSCFNDALRCRVRGAIVDSCQQRSNTSDRSIGYMFIGTYTLALARTQES